MTEITFHFNVPDRTAYACRFVRKATRLGARMVLSGPGSVLDHFDRALWVFDDLEFVPHCLLRDGDAVTERMKTTPVWLMQDASQALHHEVLVNLGSEPPIGFESFEKVVEIVTGDADDRAAARERWKHYAGRGYAIRKHEVAE